jgi:RNA polymerase sigma-70 factor (family 1)
METDLELWNRIKLDDEKAFAMLFHRYSARIFSSSYSYIRDREVCSQIVHDIFLSLWKNRKVLEIKSFNAYLTSAARYRVYKNIAQNKIIPIDYKENLESFEHISVSNSGQDKLAYQDLENNLNSNLKNLPKRCREIFIMSRKELMTNEEIANQLGISKRSVENQITYALKSLRGSLKDISILIIILEGIKFLK